MSEAETNQFVEGDFILLEGIERITLGFNDEATEVCLMGHGAGGKSWLLGFRRIPSAAPPMAQSKASSQNTAMTLILPNRSEYLPGVPEAWKSTVAIMRGENPTVSKEPAGITPVKES